jgi:hypothetical protein
MPLNHDGWGEIFGQPRIVERVNAAGFHDTWTGRDSEAKGALNLAAWEVQPMGQSEAEAQGPAAMNSAQCRSR